MKKVLALLFVLLIGFNSTALAKLGDFIRENIHTPMSVVVFMDKKIIADGRAVTEMRDVLREKFRYAKSIVIYGDDQAKSPEFLEFSDKIKTDPANEKEIKSIDIGELAKYGRAINTDYMILVTVADCNVYWNYWSGIRVDTRASVAVVDVNTQQYMTYMNYYKEGSDAFSADGAKALIKKVAAEFNWSPPAENQNADKEAKVFGEKKPAVVVFLPDVVLEKPELVEKVRKGIAAKFQASDVPIHIDDRKKGPEFLEFIGKVGTDSAKQKTFILKKERLVEYGKVVNANPVTAIVISNVGPGDDDFNYRLKEDIYVVDTESGKYLSNVVFDTVEKKKRQEGIEFLMNKLQAEFRLP
ncbi:hypothetical protein [Anaeroselena agilis]|uniref:Uncharacterized protein n=1 Tax=Anaeroselena agilis TaxID=3063788 RepID=A0ABU3NVD9_9FIRM|nr:hypothetical protein [Selenomonadales bacterium 4137-cl]